MKFSNCLKLAMVVGLAASAASAGDLNARQPITGIAPVFKGWISMKDGSISMYGSRSITDRSAYDNVGDFADGTPGVEDRDNANAPADYYFAGIDADSGDWLTLDRRWGGRGDDVGFGTPTVVGHVDSLIFGISYLGDGANPDVPVDSYHLFYDDLQTWDGSCADLTHGSFLGGFVFQGLPAADINNCGCFYAYGAGPFYDSGNGPIDIQVDDNHLVYEHFIAVAGSDPAVVDANGLAVYNGDGSGLSGGQNYMGHSMDLYLSDGGADGLYNGTDWLWYYGGAPTAANMLLNIGVAGCDSDQDGSGFSDGEDFSAFVAAFESGC